jgi:tetratricopeptide (TPR) repeat protein
VVWAAAAALLVAAVLAGGVGVWRLQQRAAAEREAEVALDEAGRLQAEAKWSEALLTLRRAEPLLNTGLLGEDPRRRVQEHLADLKMVARLEDIRWQRRDLLTKMQGDDPVTTWTDRSYGQAFRDYGIDFTVLNPEEVAEQIRNRGIRVELAAALDDWALVYQRQFAGGSKTYWQGLLALARAADPDELRGRLRNALASGDGQALQKVADSDQAEQLSPSSLVYLGCSLCTAGLRSDAVRVLREGRRRHPGDFWINYTLAHILSVPNADGKVIASEEVVRCYTAAVALRPLIPEVHCNLGFALEINGQREEALAEYREAMRFVRLLKDTPQSHFDLGKDLWEKGQRDLAAAEFREAIRLQMDYQSAHHYLGRWLAEKGRRGEAVAEFRAAALNRTGDPYSWHLQIGCYCRDEGWLEEAIAEFREAIEAVQLKKDSAGAHSLLGRVLMQKGQFRQAVEVLRLADQLDPRGVKHSAHWLRQAELLAVLDDRLPQVLKGEAQPANAKECLEFAVFCQMHKQLFAAATRWYGETFAGEPQIATDFQAGHRYNAACAAALAGCGEGKDASTLGDAERARLREQALAWLRKDLAAWRRLLEKEPEKARPVVDQQMRHWQQDPDFASVRGPEALARLPEAERPGWQKLWADVADLLAQVQGKSVLEKKADTKKQPDVRRAPAGGARPGTSDHAGP